MSNVEKKELRVALYCRVASENNLAMDVQELALRECAVKNHYKNLEFYRDNGFSGLCFETRPGFSRLIADIKAGLVDVVMVRDLARIGRGFALVMPWLEDLRARGIDFISMDQPDGPLSTEFFETMREAKRFQAMLADGK